MENQLEKRTEEAIEAIAKKMHGLNPGQLQQEIERARYAQKENKYVDFNGVQVDPKDYLTNLEAAERGLHPCFRWAQTDPAVFYGRPADPSQRKLIRVHRTY